MNSQETRALSSRAVQRAVVRGVVEHPGVIYPSILGALGGVGAVVLGPGLFTLGALVLGLSASGIALGANYFLRRERFAKNYVDTIRAENQSARESLVARLHEDFDELGEPRGRRQLEQLSNKYENFVQILDRKLAAGELTHSRYLGIAEQVYLAGIDNLNVAALALRSVSAISAPRLEAELNAESDDSEVRGVKRERLELRAQQVNAADEKFNENERAMTQLDVVSSKIASISTGDAQARIDMEVAMAGLGELIARTEKYDSEAS